MNKSLCFRNENAIKGNKTPYEAYGSDEARFSGIKERIKHLPFPKAKRFTQKEIDLEDFISRQLNDTRYISRIALHYLKHVTENVQVGSGMLTDTLKYLWGLNSTLPKAQDTKVTPGKKSREDHRHHALDAIVVACTTR
jgi:CRISPR-associated endonuclease Csn1